MNKAEEKLTKARIKLQSRNPFFSYLSLFVKFRKARDKELPKHAGMGVSPDGLLVYKEEFVNELTDEEMIGVLCLTPKTIIAGKEFKEIKDIKKDDLVLNKNGELEKVKKVFKRKVNEKIYNIKAQNLLPIKATKEHPFLVKKYPINKNLKKENRGLKEQFKGVKEKWINAEDINKGDLIAIPKIKGTFNKKKIDLKEFYPKLIQKQTHIINDFQLNNDTAWLLGLYVADGSKGNRSLRFNLNNYSKNKYFNKLKKILKKEFKITHTNIFQNKIDKGKNLEFYSTLLVNTFDNFCGKNAKTKKIPYFILYNKDKKILQSFLDGYACGDGFYYKKAKQLQLCTTSIILAQQIQLAYLRLGKLAHLYNYQRKGVYHKIRSKELKNLNNYQIIIKDNRINNLFLEDKNYIWLKVKNIDKEKYKGFVYNFETAKTHTYTANNIVLHNCHELCHLALLHLLRRGSREKTAWNIACDLATNSMLVKNRFELPKGALVPTNYEDSFEIQGKDEKVVIEKIGEKTAEQIYEEIPELKEGDDYVGGNGEKSFDSHNENSEGKPKSKSEQDELENEWRNRLEEAYIGAKQRGNVPQGLERYIDELKKSQVNWKALLRKYLQATIPNDFTWAKRSKKSRATKTYLPSVVKEKIDVCVAIDVSGSISKEDLTDFVAEIIGMAKAYQSCISMTLITHECEVNNRWEIRNGNINEIKKIKIEGGGGTSFNPVVEYINENIPRNKAIIWLTDGYAEKIETPTSYPIIWLITKDGSDEIMKDRKQDIIIWLKKTYN